MIASANYQLALMKPVPEDELANPKFLVREEDSGTRNIFEYFLNAQMIRPPKVTVEMGSNETTKQAVMAGLGLSLISAHTIASEVAAKPPAILKVEGV
jgi:DNA-binding transcriptional LysR family regulator